MLRSIVLLSLLITLAFPVAAGQGRWSELQISELTLDEAVNRTRETHRGRVLSAQEGKDGNYRIRILTDQGRVRRLRMNPESGEFIPPRRQRPRR